MARKVVDSILDAAAMASRQDTLGDMLNQIPGILQQQQQAKEAREDRLQQYADQKAFQDKQFEQTKTLSDTNLDFNVINAAMEITDPVARAAALSKIKPTTQDGYRYLNTQRDGTNSINATMKEFNTNFSSDLKNFDNLSFEQQKVLINKYENQISLNSSLSGFQTQVDNLRTRSTKQEEKRKVQVFGSNFTLDGNTDEQNSEMQKQLKMATSFEELELIIDMQTKNAGTEVTIQDYGKLLNTYASLVDNEIITPERGKQLSDEILKKMGALESNVQQQSNVDNKDSAVNYEFEKKVQLDDELFEIYSVNNQDGTASYYSRQVDEVYGNAVGNYEEMTEAEFNDAMGIVTEQRNNNNNNNNEKVSRSDVLSGKIAYVNVQSHIFDKLKTNPDYVMQEDRFVYRGKKKNQPDFIILGNTTKE